MVIGALNLFSMIPDVAFKMYLSTDNAIFGITVSIIIGILAGVIPAFLAARMDPVSAIRA
jgi:putative ABC transport system permease protein